MDENCMCSIENGSDIHWAVIVPNGEGKVELYLSLSEASAQARAEDFNAAGLPCWLKEVTGVAWDPNP